MKDKPELRHEEKLCLTRLAEAWNLFVNMPDSDEDDVTDFRRAIHEAQRIIALRVARRVNPEFWS